MKLLVIDIGNTESVLGIYHNDRLTATARLSSKTTRTADECWIFFKLWCENSGIDFATIQGAIISSVVPSLTAVFQHMVSDHLNLVPTTVTSETDTIIKINYEIPEQVGADRICNAVAGVLLYGAPLIIVDLGTATTFDVIDLDNIYLGGAIALGLMGASRELHRLAAKLPRVGLQFPKSVVGRTTEQSIQSGILWGTVALIDGMVRKIKKEMEWDQVHVIGTGGTVQLIADHSETIQTIQPSLTLEGMRFIYQHLHKKHTEGGHA